MFEQIWLFVFLISLGVSSLTTWRTLKGKQIDPPLLRSAIVATLGRAIAFSVVVYIPLINQPRISNTIALPITGVIFVLFGMALVIIASRELMKTKFDYRGLGTPEKLITTGPYSIVRHPANIGFIVAFIGWSLVWNAIYSLLTVPILVTVFVIESFLEEKNLEKVFGDVYREYRGKVGMFFPKVRRKQ